jgi:hypothetical protein
MNLSYDIDRLRAKLQNARDRLYRLETRRFYGSESRRLHVREALLDEIHELRRKVEWLETGKA